ncbi:MAG: ROK family protein [Aestuariivirga sp.]
MSDDFIGIDLGGSTLKAVRVNGVGRVLLRHIGPAGGKIVREDLVNVVRKALQHLSFKEGPIGICFGGAIQPNGMMLPTSTNLPNIANLPLVRYFEQQLGCTVRIENDARAAMLGEAWSGAARNVRSAITLTFGTGIGSGIMLDRKIISGAHGRAGEIGVWKLNDEPLQGEWLTYEDLAAPGRVETKTGKRFESIFKSGEAKNMIIWTGRALANAHLLLDLEMAVLLGGITELGEPLRAAVARAFQSSCQEDYQDGFEIKLGEHGAFAGAVGAASLWRGAVS